MNEVLAFGGGTSSGGGSCGSWGLSINEEKLWNSCYAHIYSKQHVRDHVERLGTSRRNIFNRAIRAIKLADKYSLAITGSNQIWTIFNGYLTTVRFFVKEGSVINLNIIPDKAPDRKSVV